MSFLRIMVLLSMVAMLGCPASESVSVDPVQEAPDAANAKIALEEVAESGVLGSGAMLLRESLERVEQSEALLADMDELEKLTDPAAVKAKAKEMADKL